MANLKFERYLNKRTMRKADTIVILLSLVFVIQVFIPLGMMFVRMNLESLQQVIQSESFGAILENSLLAAMLSTIISVSLAYILAICVERIKIRCKGIFISIFMLPMLIPSISNGMGLVFLLGNNGILTNLFGLNINIYGLTGIVIGSVMYSFPVAFLMLLDVMKYENGSTYEAAKVLGISKFHQFTKITLPYLRKPLITVIFTTFTMVVTDYGIPLMVGGKYKTIPVVMYQEVIGQLDFGKGAVYGMFLLIPAVIAFVIDFVTKDKANSEFITKPVEASGKRSTKVFAYGCCILVAIEIIMPIIAFALTAFTKSYPYDFTVSYDNILKTVNMRAGQYLLNSIFIAFLVSIVGVSVAFMIAYMSARMKSRASRFLHLSVIITAAVPGIVLGLTYILTFKATPIYGTIFILVLVNIIHFIASPYLMIYNSLSKANKNLEAVGHTLRIGRFYMIRDVFVPICRGTLLEMFSYFFVNCMMTISAISFLATTIHKPLSLMITQFEAQMQMGAAAVVSLMILGVNIVMKLIIYYIKNKK